MAKSDTRTLFFIMTFDFNRKTRSVPNTSQEQSNSQGQTLFQIQFVQNFFSAKWS